LDVIPTLNETWDLVFIDADKQNYIEYYELILPFVRSGGYVILDNVLWSGKVAEPGKNDKDTVLLRKLNDLIHEDERVEEVLLPIRDGLMIARKK
jgi:predicted O-methyltransferase YrrM